jgi:hypothetical protein
VTVAVSQPYRTLVSELAPIFIMGSHRSGTTWLHQLMAETGCFGYLSAYNVIRYDLFAAEPRQADVAPGYRELCETFAKLGLSGRVIDDAKISPDVPVEYGFVLNNAGTGLRLTPKNLSILHDTCQRLAHPAARPIVLKNPWDYSNFLYLKQAIPKARFVFVHRHPERVIHSGLKAIRSVFNAKSPFLALLSRDYERLYSGTLGQRLRLRLQRFLVSSRWNIGLRLIAARLAKSHLYFLKAISQLAPSDALSLRYEDLCESPREQFGRVLEFAGVDPGRAASLPTSAKPRNANLLPEIEAYRGAIARKTAAYMELHGYKPGGGVEPLGS